MSTMIRCVLVTIAVLTASAVALAHEGEDHGGGADKHLMGTVDSVAGRMLTVKATDGKTVAVHVDDHTQYDKGGAPGKAADVKPGAKVVVHGETMKDGTLHATKIRLGKSAASPAPSKDAPSKKDHADHPKK